MDCLLSATESVLLVPKAMSESSVSVALSQLVNAIAAKTSRRHRRLAVLYIRVVIVQSTFSLYSISHLRVGVSSISMRRVCSPFELKVIAPDVGVTGWPSIQ